MKYYNKLVQDFRDIAHRFITIQLCFVRPKDDHTHQVISTTDRHITTTGKKSRIRLP